VLSESAAHAAAIAIEEGLSVQQVEYGKLKPVLLKSGQKL
jgi:hypothetical protein